MFTDIEHSTEMVHDLGDRKFDEILSAHNEVIRGAFERHDGTEVGTEGDSFFAVFTDPMSGVSAALDIQSELMSRSWSASIAPRVRIGLHTGQASLGGANYVGVDVHKASRVAHSAHGGQVLISGVTAQLLSDGLPPGAHIRSLGRYQLAGFQSAVTLHQVWSEGLPDDFPPPRAPRAESGIPVPHSQFIGREEELEAAVAALGQTRLLTLTGPGGTGKTRLSIELARKVEPEFRDGAAFVTLATLRDPDLIPSAILEVLRLKTAGGVEPEDHLKRHLADKTMLLVLDNLEQIVAGADLISRILEAAPALKIIASSRIPLRIVGEHEFPVPPLAVPEENADDVQVEHSAGVRLFVERAKAVRPGFYLDDANRRTVATIARTLDGLPLAIELAASRIRSLTPQSILERLDNRLLSSAIRDRPERQQTIVNAISWSYDLLDEPVRRLFEDLSVFIGSFGLDEAETVFGSSVAIDVLDGITHLVDHSLLRQTELTGEPRFRMLTVIREFAYGALVARGDEGEALDRHGEVYLAIAEESANEILTSRQEYWLGRLTADHDNLRAVFDRSLARGDGMTALRVAAALWRFWQIRGHLGEAAEKLEQALAMTPDADPQLRGQALTGLGGIKYWQGRWEEILQYYQAALEIFGEHGPEMQYTEALYNISFAFGFLGRIEEADGALLQAEAIAKRIGYDLGVARAEWGLSVIAGYKDDYQAVLDHAHNSIALFQRLDAPFDLGWAWFMEAQGHVKLGHVEEARSALRPAVEIFAKVEDVSALTLIIEMMVMLCLAIGERGEAGYLAGGAHRLKADTGVEIGDVQLNQFPEVAEFVANRNEEEEAAFQRGFQAPLAEVVQEVRSLLQ